LMLYSYAGFPERSFALFERVAAADESEKSSLVEGEAEAGDPEPSPASSVRSPTEDSDSKKGRFQAEEIDSSVPVVEGITELPTHGEPSGHTSRTRTPSPQLLSQESTMTQEVKRNLIIKENTMSGLSIALTLISILVAFSISLIEIMGLIGDNCGPCQRAADDPEGGGLAGSWWRGWARANDESGFIGAAIVGGFVLVVIGWYSIQWATRRFKARRQYVIEEP